MGDRLEKLSEEHCRNDILKLTIAILCSSHTLKCSISIFECEQIVVVSEETLTLVKKLIAEKELIKEVRIRNLVIMLNPKDSEIDIIGKVCLCDIELLVLKYISNTKCDNSCVPASIVERNG
jgi:hypothetical protein